jgi:hypothetical protein
MWTSCSRRKDCRDTASYERLAEQIFCNEIRLSYALMNRAEGHVAREDSELAEPDRTSGNGSSWRRPERETRPRDIVESGAGGLGG